MPPSNPLQTFEPTQHRVLSGMGQTANRRWHHERQIRVARLEAALGDHAVNLAAMVGLMVEHMGDQDPFRARDLNLRRARDPCQLAVEPAWIE